MGTRDEPRVSRALHALETLAERNPAKVVLLPLTGLAAIGGALSLLGNRLPLFFITITSATSVMLLLLWAIERSRTAQLRLDQSQDARIDQLSDVVGQIDCAVKILSTCCYATAHNGTRGEHTQVAGKPGPAPALTSFDRLEEVTIDLLSEMFSGPKRIALYYGSQERLTSTRHTGWYEAEPPTLSKTPLTDETGIVSPRLMESLRTGSYLNIDNVNEPESDVEDIAGQVPNRREFKTFACFPMRAFESLKAAKRQDCRLIGAVIVQHAQAGALASRQSQVFVPLLANLLAAGALHSAKNGVLPAGEV